MLKRVAVMLLCLMMVFIATFGFVVGVVAVPTIYSYAAVNDDSIYVPLRDPSDLVVGFQSYCKSRDLTIEGSLTDAVTTFTTGAFNSACNEIGINISQLQAEIKAEYDSSGKPVKFLFNDSGVMAMNRIFAQFLQDNELEVGDTDVNKQVYDGKYYNNSLIYITNNSTINSSVYPNGNILQRGSYYEYSQSGVIGLSNSNINFHIGNDTYTYYVSNYTGTTSAGRTANNAVGLVNDSSKYKELKADNIVSGQLIRTNVFDYTFYGYPIIYNVAGTNQYYLGLYIDRYDSVYSKREETIKMLTSLTDNNQFQNTNIIIVSNTINNNIYEGDTIINNEGDIITEPDPVPPGGSDPGWDIGGGGGTATDGDGNTWNIQFPDFELPDLNIDWSINGLGEKFPFSIPFDLVALVTVLNAEPQAPRFEGTVNFGFTTWNYDINLQQFDSVAQACRIAELLLLVVGLILVTRSIIKG